ncbi:MarR family winged helix-turn-helix transcriptional regulator [Clostridium sp.]|uniref:MarR family winged helix-turn-helix transcriptional regulator n=1 Tax=Clostridium sp. TaxID=1506 RepID=UPI003F319BB4
MKMYETESISRYINQFYRQGLSYLGKEYKDYGIGAGQYQFLVYLYIKDGLTHDELTEKIGVDKAITTRVISKLMSEGYIEKVQDNQDKRKFYIYLTDYAKEKREAILDISKKWEKELIKDISEDELIQLYKILRKMSKSENIYTFCDEEI